MISSYGKAIAISGDDPDAEFRSGGFEAAGDGSCSSVDGVHAIGIHIIGKAAAAADTGYDHYIFTGDAKGRHHLLHLRQDGVVSTTRAPAYFLIGGEVFGGKSGRGDGCRCVHSAKLQHYT